MNWQPIETAPKDGTFVVVWPPTWEGALSCARWDPDKYARKPRTYWRRADGHGVSDSRNNRKIEDLKSAMVEAERFLAAARQLREANAYAWMVKASNVPNGRESAAVRRASLDLSRALADMRRRGA